MNNIIRISSYPHDNQVALIHAGTDLNTIMGQLPEARWLPDSKAYLLHIDAIPGLSALAQHHHIHVVDQRTTTNPRHKPQPQECRHCAQPGSWSHPPTTCPNCGQPWDPVPPPTHHLDTNYPDCPGCGHHQTGRHPYCTHCGHHLGERTLNP